MTEILLFLFLGWSFGMGWDGMRWAWTLEVRGVVVCSSIACLLDSKVG